MSFKISSSKHVMVLALQAMFVLVDIEEKSVTGSVVWPYPNMSIMECMISPDKMQVSSRVFLTIVQCVPFA